MLDAKLSYLWILSSYYANNWTTAFNVFTLVTLLGHLHCRRRGLVKACTTNLHSSIEHFKIPNTVCKWVNLQVSSIYSRCFGNLLLLCLSWRMHAGVHQEWCSGACWPAMKACFPLGWVFLPQLRIPNDYKTQIIHPAKSSNSYCYDALEQMLGSLLESMSAEHIFIVTFRKTIYY